MELRKLLFTGLSCLMLLSTSLKAQESEAGFKGGLNFTNFYNSEVNDQNMRIGFNGGLFVKASITPFFAIQPEFLYTQKGSTTQYDNFLTGDGEFSQNLNYMEVPLLAVINLGENFNIHAGPYAAYLVSANLENVSENSDFNFVEELDADDFERLDYGLSTGVEFESEVIRLGFRYDYGMREIGKEQNFSLNESEVSSDAISSSRNSAFSVYLGLSF